ncbi:hypothetical protein [Streptomyces malaysiensis]|uniref:hypothetical protein n=1 Tax=Streptomyces malaysiensis TaxID=92644 RepID=UPI0032209A8D|nr:hypothetical protein [Streptomyces malaysiensis]
MSDEFADAAASVAALVGDRAGGWDLDGLIPEPLLRELGATATCRPSAPPSTARATPWSSTVTRSG